MILLAGCSSAPRRDQVSFSYRKVLGIEEQKVYLPFPEAISFEIPVAKWTPIKVNQQPEKNSYAALFNGTKEKNTQLIVESQNKQMFEEIERKDGNDMDFNQPDSLVIIELQNFYTTKTLNANPEKKPKKVQSISKETSLEYAPGSNISIKNKRLFMA